MRLSKIASSCPIFFLITTGVMAQSKSKEKNAHTKAVVKQGTLLYHGEIFSVRTILRTAAILVLFVSTGMKRPVVRIRAIKAESEREVSIYTLIK